MPKILITREIPRAGINLLKQHPELELDYRCGPPLSEKELLDSISGVDAILPVIPDKITKEVIDAAGKNLKIISTYSVGYDHIDVDYATSKGIFVGNTPGDKTTKSVAGHALAMILAIGNKLVDADEYCKQGKYKYWEPMKFLGTRTTDKTLGIIGFGRIGKHLARMAVGLEMKVLYNDKIKLSVEEENKLKVTYSTKENLLENSDFVSIHCNLCDDTRHLIGEHEFHLMKPEASLINTSRGAIVNEEALVRALTEGWIQGAGLDVFENEPKIHPGLLKLKNVILTPHVASGTREVRIQMALLATQNIIDVLINNKPPTHLVNKNLISSII